MFRFGDALRPTRNALSICLEFRQQLLQKDVIVLVGDRRESVYMLIDENGHVWMGRLQSKVLDRRCHDR